MNDLISRKAVMECFDKYHHRMATQVLEFQDELKSIPSAEPKKGRWNWIGFNIECSLCGFTPCFDSTEPLYNYCPHCGARMEEE